MNFPTIISIQYENKQKMRKHFAFASFMWAQKDLNLRPADYESAALTN